MDAHLGCLWTLNVSIEVVPRLIEQNARLTDFLLNRENGKPVVLRHVAHLARKAISDAAIYESLAEDDCDFNSDGLGDLLDEFAYMFRRLGEILREHIRSVGGNLSERSNSEYAQATVSTPLSVVNIPHSSINRRPFIIEPGEIQTSVFFVAQGNENPHVRQFFYSLLIEYIRSLVDHEVPVDHWLYELLVSSIARLENYSQLSYCIQSGFLADSKPIALQLLALESVYPAAGQLAVDMLKRLKFSGEEIIDVLLLKHKLTEALRFCQMNPYLLNQPNGLATRFLDLAVKSNDKKTFFTIYRFFQCLPAHTLTSKTGEYEELLTKFSQLFGNPNS